MKKFTKVFAVMLVCMLAVSLLCACGVNQKAADKINQAAKDGKHMTFEELKKSYGDPTVNGAGGGSLIGATGVVVWVNGCKTLEEAQKKLDEGKKLEALTVTLLNGKATAASYGEWDGKTSK